MSRILDECRDNPGAPNLDAYEYDDLMEFYHENKHPRNSAAIIVFPERSGDLESCKALYRLAQYAETKADAMQSRSSGNINRASVLERYCNAIYDNLPEWAQW